MNIYKYADAKDNEKTYNYKFLVYPNITYIGGYEYANTWDSGNCCYPNANTGSCAHCGTVSGGGGSGA